MKMKIDEQTGRQVSVSWGESLSNPVAQNYAAYRTMRKHPTIALVRSLLAAPVLANSWGVESREDADDDAVEFVRDQFIGLREAFLETAMFGGIDFGWAPFEKIFSEKNGRVVIRKIKPLLQDMTTILVDQTSGAFNGYKQTSTTTTGVVLPLEYSLHVGFRVEGTNWYGQGLLENARSTYNDWVEANNGAKRYDRKVAGSHFVVFYPPGTSRVKGVETGNADVAETILEALESSGSIKVPTFTAQYVEELNEDKLGWRIEILEDKGGRQPTFIDRLRYLDVLMVRALFMPERALLEGQYGTKAEAGEHAHLAVTNLELMESHVVRHLNWYAVDHLLALNWGEEARGTVWLAAAPLVDEAVEFLRKIYEALLKNPSTLLEEYSTMDLDALKEKLAVPRGNQGAEEEPLDGLEDEELESLAEVD